MSVDLRGRVVSRSYGDAENRALAPAHRVVDLSLSRPLRSWINAYAVLENIFDEQYYLALTPTALRSAPPRTISGGVRMRIATGGTR